MLYTTLTKKALNIMFNAHKEQTDKSGMPYVFHPYEVASSLDDEYTVCIALLHDVAEDTDITIDDLSKLGFPSPVIDALRLLCHNPKETYISYIQRIKSNELARKVKLADLRHNSDLTRLDSISGYDLVRAEKYAMAIRYLEEE